MRTTPIPGLDFDAVFAPGERHRLAVGLDTEIAQLQTRASRGDHRLVGIESRGQRVAEETAGIHRLRL